MHHPTQTSREVTSRSDKEAPFNNAAHCAHDGVIGGNKRLKQNPLGTATMTSRDDDRGWEAGSSRMGHAFAAMRNSRRLVRSPIDHFKRLLEEACPNHAYPVRHKFKDNRMMQIFMTSESLSWGAGTSEGPDGSDIAPFPEENAVMMVVGGCPLEGRHHMSKLGPRISTHGGWGRGGSRV
jgi:hypothetical protein